MKIIIILILNFIISTEPFSAHAMLVSPSLKNSNKALKKRNLHPETVSTSINISPPGGLPVNSPQEPYVQEVDKRLLEQNGAKLRPNQREIEIDQPQIASALSEAQKHKPVSPIQSIQPQPEEAPAPIADSVALVQQPQVSQRPKLRSSVAAIARELVEPSTSEIPYSRLTEPKGLNASSALLPNALQPQPHPVFLGYEMPPSVVPNPNVRLPLVRQQTSIDVLQKIRTEYEQIGKIAPALLAVPSKVRAYKPKNKELKAQQESLIDQRIVAILAKIQEDLGPGRIEYSLKPSLEEAVFLEVGAEGIQNSLNKQVLSKKFVDKQMYVEPPSSGAQVYLNIRNKVRRVQQSTENLSPAGKAAAYLIGGTLGTVATGGLNLVGGVGLAAVAGVTYLEYKLGQKEERELPFSEDRVSVTGEHYGSFVRADYRGRKAVPHMVFDKLLFFPEDSTKAESAVLTKVLRDADGERPQNSASAVVAAQAN